jgi:Protein of unknown function (DUF3558)
MERSEMIRTNLLGWSGALAVSALVIAACGGSTNGANPTGAANGGATSPSTITSSAPGSAATDACALLTQQEASTAIGAAAGPPDNSLGCTYKGPAGETVSVLLAPGDRARFDAARTHQQGNPGYQDVPGAGDSAFLVSGSGGGQFYCLKGSSLMTITLSLVNGTPTDALLTLGKTAAGRL